MKANKWLLALFVMGLAVCGRGAEGSADAVQKWVTDYGLIFNQRKADKLALFWVEDGDIISGGGRSARGRSAIAHVLEQELSSIPKGLDTTFSVGEIRTIRPDILVVNVIRNRHTPIESQKVSQRTPVTTLDTFVLEKREGKWMIVSARSVASGFGVVVEGSVAPPGTVRPIAPPPPAPTPGPVTPPGIPGHPTPSPTTSEQ